MKLWTYCRLPPYFYYLHDETEFSCKQKKNSKLWLNTITETKLNIVHRNRLFTVFAATKSVAAIRDLVQGFFEEHGPLLNYTFYFFLLLVSLSSWPLCFIVSRNPSITFFLISWAFFFCFRYQIISFEYLLPFYVHFLQICL